MTEECHKNGDNVDAIGIHRKCLEKSEEEFLVRAMEEWRKESEEYKMDHKYRGKCYIFNQKVFDSHMRLAERHGTDVDANNLHCRFTDLGFDTKVFTDLTVREVYDKLQEAGKEDHSDRSCFVCCILSHGASEYLFARDGMYHTEDIFAPFRPDVCPSLIGKPKLFFIEASRNAGVGFLYRESTVSVHQFKIPTHADILVSYSTVPGFHSWRNTTNGSWFIQALCAALEEHAKTKDIIQILTIVNRKVACDFESCTPHDVPRHGQKQMPLIASMLTRDLKFF